MAKLVCPRCGRKNWVGVDRCLCGQKIAGVLFENEYCPNCGRPYFGSGWIICGCPKDATQKALEEASQMDIITPISSFTGIPAGCLVIMCILAAATLVAYMS